ncbi:hypothetical protein VTK73DRAFT_9464 [Phialemonium thermophilum]|uniref:Xylanolytic transcriptional activator regulatory domain-containing protein n=1 Tax=Phialemonium thermophilum TaxID=223376 RepID=A0ABR3W1Z3_9PEZI
MAVCLLVLAIGSLMASTRTADAAPYDHETGLGYFSLAYQLLTTEWATHLTPEPSLTTGLLLAAIYLRCLGRPLQAWKAISMASSNVQFEALRLRGNPSGQHYEDVVHRQCWTCFVLEW